MDAEYALISKCAKNRKLTELVAMGIEEDHFANEECKSAWASMVGHYKKYRDPPSLEAFRRDHPDFPIQLIDEPIEYITDEFVKTVKRRAAVEKCRILARSVDDPKDIARIDEVFLEAANDLASIIPSSGVAKFSQMLSRYDLYRERVREGEPPGIPFGIPALDELTMGIQKHEYVSIVGWQGTGKSTLLQWLFFNAYVAGRTPMLISLEMEAESLFKKWDAMAVQFKHRALRALTLPDADLKRWEEAAERADKAPNDIIVLDRLGKCTPEKIHAEAIRYGPDLVGVDYISLLDAPTRYGALWEKVTHITQNLKMVARTLNKPIFGVAQTNINSADEGAKLENISYSRSIGQDSDIVLGLYQSEDQRAKQQMELRVLKNRDGIANRTIKLKWNMEIMEFREWEESDMFQTREVAAV